jgi:hypothetical protein
MLDILWKTLVASCSEELRPLLKVPRSWWYRLLVSSHRCWKRLPRLVCIWERKRLVLGPTRHKRYMWLEIPTKVVFRQILDRGRRVIEYIIRIVNYLNALPYPLATRERWKGRLCPSLSLLIIAHLRLISLIFSLTISFTRVSTKRCQFLHILQKLILWRGNYFVIVSFSVYLATLFRAIYRPRSPIDFFKVENYLCGLFHDCWLLFTSWSLMTRCYFVEWVLRRLLYFGFKVLLLAR